MCYTRSALSGCSSHCTEYGKLHATHSVVHQPFHPYGGAYNFGGLAEGYLIPPLSLHHGEESSFPGTAPHNDMVHSKSLEGIKPGDSGVMIGYQVDKFTCTWSAECFTA